MTKDEREKVKEIYKLLCAGFADTAKRLLKDLRDAGVKAGPSHDREDVGIVHDKTQIVDYSNTRL